MNVVPQSSVKDSDARTPPEKVLFVDDEENLLVAYQRSLHRFFQIETAASASEALQMIERNGPYAVIVADMAMPGMDGAQLLARCKLVSPDSIRVMVTGNADQQTAVKAVNQGEVFRFLNKPCERELLVETLDAALVLYRQGMDEKQKLNRSLADVDRLMQLLNTESMRDLLTGLRNRHAFEAGLRETLAASDVEESTSHALCHLDIDHFHVVNEASGQVAGDALLRAVGEFLTSKCGVDDLVGRVAGDDFAILFRGASLSRAYAIVSGDRQHRSYLHPDWTLPV